MHGSKWRQNIIDKQAATMAKKILKQPPWLSNTYVHVYT